MIKEPGQMTWKTKTVIRMLFLITRILSDLPEELHKELKDVATHISVWSD